ncbi:unnamed protein product [Allacma fusca]|uniref:Uncharacterized protein n=1 Tax=Allacma fusca TaxID=39272 RepID=A0A8J2LP50_9HEXA|nr:unnamed protein product [Allacma fusca]
MTLGTRDRSQKIETDITTSVFAKVGRVHGIRDDSKDEDSVDCDDDVGEKAEHVPQSSSHPLNWHWQSSAP